ncbi:ParA family protein [Pseudoalteromonas luteoviolacea]|uniref:ParA family protein n=1 Tax=Pseudoalteromonas luteoviolacea TaxID=43657 RepID=UPI001B366028|nr:ParA family protein [Pseudoalteromonas luteoviolacea]MBQ4839812.1 ParA family protein [Pseudoalteromonas luteoviolacea]
MARVIAPSAQKGGVGKTTMSVQGALATAVKLSARTLLIDVDPQGNSSGSFLTPEDRAAHPEVSASALYVDNSNLKPIPGKYGVDVIPGDDGINAFPQELSGTTIQEIIGSLSDDASANDIISGVVDEQLIAFVKNVQQFKAQYDYIWIDTPPSFLGLPLISALCAATDVVSVLEPTKFSSDVIDSFIDKVSTVKEQYNPSLTFHGFVINKLRATSERHKNTADQWLAEYPEFFLGTSIKVNSWIEATTEDGEPVWKKASNEHRKKGARNLLSALGEFIPELQEVTENV